MKNAFKKMIQTLMLVLIVSCGGEKMKQKIKDNPEQIKPKLSIIDKAAPPDIAKELQTQLLKMNQFPTLTLVLIPTKDLQSSINNLLEGGGKLVYDPNNRLSSTIPFYIAELTPEQINNTKFIKSLHLKAASIDSKKSSAMPIENKITSKELEFENFIPTNSVNIEKLGDKTTLGQGVTVAVIDTGTDASHPAFGGRVVYWYDATQETRTELKKMNVVGNTIQVSLEGKEQKITLPKAITAIKDVDVFAAIMSEKSFTGQLSAQEKMQDGFLDLNKNKSADEFLVVLTKKDDELKVYFDRTGDLKLKGAVELEAKIDYNETTKTTRELGMVSFPTRNNILKYPILLEEDGDKIFIGLGNTQGSHGTHVAGIIAADDQDNNLLGAAPKADLMSIRVCSGLTCTDSAIVKGLYQAFYNGKVIPDVVNISLGSHEAKKRSIYSYLINDLSAKFGAIFFISASNSGPGFRSLNHFGNSGAAVMVGANVSDQTLRDQYNLPASGSVSAENLLFFSSLGPSYTGEMKPNIIAPGAAISAVPASGEYMTQMNGTSMSSPLAAGAFAAVLGKTMQESSDLFETIKQMRSYHLKGSKNAKKSLLPYVYAMRDSLQNAAQELPGLTRAQQGYGLLRAGKTKDLLLEYLLELKEGTRDYFEVVINENKEGYNRSTKIEELKTFSLSLGSDGERTKESFAKLISLGLEVELNRVEVLSTDGSVEVVTGDERSQYFSMIDRGDRESQLMRTHVSFHNRRTPEFISKRSLGNMKEGKTYIAHYTVSSNGAVVNNILDVIHRAFELKERKLDVPSISPEIKKTKTGFAVISKEIKTNVFHRYPILIEKSINAISVKLGIDSIKGGRLFVQLYNPDGREVSFVLAESTPTKPYSQALINVSTLKDGKTQAGIWEVTISSSSSSWMAPSQYDLLIEGSRFGAKMTKALVRTGSVKTIPVQLGGHPLTKVILTNVKRVETTKVKVKSAFVSFHPLKLEEGYIGRVGVSISDTKKSYWGNVISKLYVKRGREFEAFKGKYKFEGIGFNIIEKLPETVYFALDTISNYSSDALENSTTTSVLVELTTAVKDITPAITFENIDQMDLALVKVDTSSMSEQKHTYRGNLLMISGPVEEFRAVDGSVIFNTSDSNIMNSLELTIQKKK